MAKSKKIRNKFPAMITYIIAVLALVCGLLLPLGTKSLTDGGIDFQNIPALQITGAIAALLAPFGVTFNLPFGVNLSASYSKIFSVFGVFDFDIGALLFILYAVATLLALIMLIPVCALNRRKDSPRKIAVAIENFALTVLLAMALLKITDYVVAGDWYLSILIPLGLLLLIKIVQSIAYFGGSGVMKTVIFFISSLAALVTILNVFTVIPQLAEPVNNLLAKMQSARPFETAIGLYSINGVNYFGSDIISLFFSGLATFEALLVEGHWADILLHLLGLIVVAYAIGDIFSTMNGIGKRTTRRALVLDLVRYIFELLFICVLSVIISLMTGNFGLCLYILAILTVLQLIIAIARLSLGKTVKAKNRVEQKSDSVFDKGVALIPERVTSSASVAEETAVTAAPAPVLITPAPIAAPAKNMLPAEAAYDEPLDNFMRKLTNEERTEFKRIFIDRSYGRLNIPDYVIGGENSGFFSSIFIYLARVRDLVSDALMNKLYEEVKLLG